MSHDSSHEVTELLAGMGRGDRRAAERLLPMIYEELRRLARGRMARERPGHTLQATALVHEAYLRLVGEETVSWENRAHFFGAAAEAMRRILIERARRVGRLKRGGDRRQVSLDDAAAQVEPPDEDILELDAALTALERRDPRMADVVKLRYFAGLTVAETASALDLSERSVNRAWTAARAWLLQQIRTSS